MAQQQVETLNFGAGIMFGFPSGGQTGTNLTPVEIGVIQNAKVDVSAEIKSLFGLYSFPIDTAIGKRQIKGSAAFAQYEGTAWNQLMFGSAGSATTGAAQIASYREAGTIPAAPAYTVTVAQSAHFVQDGGVRYAATGQPLAAVASGPTAGQYTVSAGVYTFAAADANKAVVITYTYSSTTNNQTFTVTNTAMGSGPTIGMYLYLPYQSTSFASLDRGLYMPNCRVGGFSLATKLDDYTEENMSFEAFANPITGVVFQNFLPW